MVGAQSYHRSPPDQRRLTVIQDHLFPEQNVDSIHRTEIFHIPLDSFLCSPANRMKYLFYCLGHEYDHSNTENLEVELLCVEDFSVGKKASLLLLVT